MSSVPFPFQPGYSTLTQVGSRKWDTDGCLTQEGTYTLNNHESLGSSFGLLALSRAQAHSPPKPSRAPFLVRDLYQLGLLWDRCQSPSVVTPCIYLSCLSGDVLTLSVLSGHLTMPQLGHVYITARAVTTVSLGIHELAFSKLAPAPWKSSHGNTEFSIG